MKEEQRRAARALRDAEGGRGGGYNDRQNLEKEKGPAHHEDDASGVDDFGRRRLKCEDAQEAVRLSKAERARAALERLKHKAKGAGSGSAAQGRSRSRSRSGSGRLK